MRVAVTGTCDFQSMCSNRNAHKRQTSHLRYLWFDLCACVAALSQRQADGGVTCICAMAGGVQRQQAARTEERAALLYSTQSNICPLCSQVRFEHEWACWAMLSAGFSAALSVGAQGPSAHTVIIHSSEGLSSSSGSSVSHGGTVCLYLLYVRVLF